MSPKRKWWIKKIGKGWWIGRGHFALGDYFSTWERAMGGVEYRIKEETRQKISQLLIEAFKQDEGAIGGNWVDFAPDGRTVLDGDWKLEEVAQFLIDRGFFIKEEL